MNNDKRIYVDFPNIDKQFEFQSPNHKWKTIIDKEHVNDCPRIINSYKPDLQDLFINEIDSFVKDSIESLKKSMIHDLAEILFETGMIREETKFDFDDHGKIIPPHITFYANLPRTNCIDCIFYSDGHCNSLNADFPKDGFCCYGRIKEEKTNEGVSQD